MARKGITIPESLRKSLKVAGYVVVTILLYALVSDPVLKAISDVINVRVPDVVLAGAINVILVAIAKEIKERLPKDNAVARML